MSADEHLDEKAFNKVLADVMASHNRVAGIDAEKTGKLLDQPGKRGAQPDVTVVHLGRERVLIENKYDDRPERELVKQCRERLMRKWANGLPVRAVVGLRTPHRMASVADVAAAIGEASDFQWAAWTFRSNRLPQSGWVHGSIAEFVGFVARVGAEAADTDEHTTEVKDALTAAGSQIGVDTPASRGFGKVLLQEPCLQTNRMAMAVMFNAIVFQSHIAKHHDEVSSPTQMLAAGGATQLTVLEEWGAILEINYWPIFGVSRELLLSISDESVANNILNLLFVSASRVASVPGAQGLIGRIFGELIGDRKFLATFYTLPSAAALLADMAVERLDVEWPDPDAITALRVGDMACGTGALLTAVYARIYERHLLAGGKPEELHQRTMEDMMIGCDIMPAAVHLTAARLSGEHPNIDYTSTKTWVMPYGSVADIGGASVIKLGSLDLQHTQDAMALWGDGTIAASAKGEVRHTTAHIDAESLDLVIMNPPFTRPTNHEASHRDIPNPAFAGMGNDEEAQEAMGKALKPLLARIPDPKASNGNAGLASNFVDLAHAKLRPGGILALVLPAIAVSGASWREARQLLSNQYRDISVVTISSQGSTTTDRAFSADTGMGEVLIVAQKRSNESNALLPRAGEATFIVLEDRPPTVAWAVETARAVYGTQEGHLTVGEDEIGWSVLSDFGLDIGHPSGVGEADVALFARSLCDGQLRPARMQGHTLPIADLASLSHVGPVHRDINGINRRSVKGKVVSSPRGPFVIKELKKRTLFARASYPTLWSHDAKLEKKMEVLPSSTARPRTGMQDQALKVWTGGYETQTTESRKVAGATRLHINTDFRVTSQALGACLTPVQTLGGRAWPSLGVSLPEDSDQTLLWEKALCVWLNTTPGLVARWWVSSRQQQGRACLTVTTLGKIPVLDLRELTREQLEKLADLFDTFSGRDLLPANQADQDTVRQELDEQVLCGVLRLPPAVLDPLSTLRHQWCKEPSNL